MKTLLKKRAILFYLSISSSIPSFVGHPILAQTQIQIKITVALPDTVTVKFKQGRRMSGIHLLEINHQTQKVKLEQSGRTENRDITSIESITFKGKVILKGGKPVIRGEGNDGGNCGTQDTWNLPLNYVLITDTKEGKIEAQSNS